MVITGLVRCGWGIGIGIGVGIGIGGSSIWMKICLCLQRMVSVVCLDVIGCSGDPQGSCVAVVMVQYGGVFFVTVMEVLVGFVTGGGLVVMWCDVWCFPLLPRPTQYQT